MARGYRSLDEENPGHAPFTYSSEVKCVGTTPKALKCRPTNGDASDAFWLPRSVIHDDSEVYDLGDEGSLIVKKWYAESEGWVGDDD